MRLLLVICLALLSSSLFALTPKVGHSVTFSHSFSIMGMEFDGITKKTIIDYNKKRDEYLLDTSQVYGEFESKNRIWVHSVPLKRTYIENSVNYCEMVEADYPHRVETISVEAGDFTSCFVDNSYDDIITYNSWYSDEVPFGIVKQFNIDPVGDYDKQALLNFSL